MGEVSKKSAPDLKRLFQLEMYRIAGYFGISREKITEDFCAVLLGIISKRYKGFLISDFKEAFELLLCGELDSFLPKDSHGQPDKKVYGELTVEFVMKIINSYKRRKESRESKPIAFLGHRKTPEELWEIRKRFISPVCTWADEEYPKPYHLYDEYLYSQFVEWGLVPASGLKILCTEWTVIKKDEVRITIDETNFRRQYAALINKAVETIKATGQTLYQIVKNYELQRVAPYNDRKQ